MIGGARLRLIGELRPARADIDAGGLQAPQHGHRIADIEIILRRIGAKLLVIELERFVGLAELEMKQRPVPPDVIGKIVAAAPTRLGALQPGDAVAALALHLVHMCDRMHRPGIAGIERHRLLANVAGGAIIAAFLQAEGIHAAHEAAAGLVRRPIGQDAGDRGAHGEALAHIEMAVMSEAQRQHVARMIDQDALPALGAFDHVAGAPGFERFEMFAFPRAHHLGELARLLGAFLRLLFERRQGEELEEIAAQAMAHEEPGIGAERRFEMRAGIAPIAEKGAQGFVVMIDGLAARRRHGQAEAIVMHRTMNPCARVESPGTMAHSRGTQKRGVAPWISL